MELSKMKYTNADNVIPEHLLKELQKYIQGEMIYIPKPEGTRKQWGSSGSRERLKIRNNEILDKFQTGKSIYQLGEEFCLSMDSIKKIVYSKSLKARN